MKNRKTAVYRVKQKLVEQGPPQIWFKLIIKFQGKHNLFMSGRGIIILESELCFTLILLWHFAFGLVPC